MGFARRLRLLLRSLNPGQYPKLCAELSFKGVLAQFFFSFFLFLFVMAVLLVIFLPLPALRTTFASLSFNGSMHGSATLLFDPLVRADFTENATLKDEKAILALDGLHVKQWYFFGNSFVSWAALRSGNAPVVLFLLLLPSLLFWLALVLLLKYFFLIGLGGLVAFVLPRLFAFRISFANGYKLAVLAAIPMAVLELVTFAFWWLPLVSLCLFLAFLFIGVVVVGDRALGEEPRRHKV